MTTTDLAVVQPQRQSLVGFTPRDAKGLAWLANEVVKSGMFKVGPRAMTGSEAFVVMMKGAELGLTPMQSLAEISIIKGRPFVSKDVLTARITRSPRCRHWDPSDCDATHCTIHFQVAGGEQTSLTTNIDDIPQRYFKPSQAGEPSNWTLVPEDMLFAWTVRRIARRWFPEALLDIGDAAPDYDETKVINVAAVEREVGASEFGQHTGCGGTLYLQSSGNGGAYLRCQKCSETFPPPQDVRDLVRGTPEALTLAGPQLEDGERQMTPEEIEAFDTMQAVHNEEQAAFEKLGDPPPSDNGADTIDAEVTPSSEPPADAPVDAAENAGGSLSFAERWTLGAQKMLLDHIERVRTEGGAAKIAVRDALLEAKWSGRPEHLEPFIYNLDDVALGALLTSFGLGQPTIAK